MLAIAELRLWQPRAQQTYCEGRLLDDRRRRVRGSLGLLRVDVAQQRGRGDNGGRESCVEPHDEPEALQRPDKVEEGTTTTTTDQRTIQSSSQAGWRKGTRGKSGAAHSTARSRKTVGPGTGQQI